MSEFWVKDKNFYKTLLLLAIPIILQNIITQGVSVADNMMVGKLGETAISGLYFSNRIQLVMQILLVGLDSSIVILASQYWGKRDCDHIKDVVSIAAVLATGFTSLVALASICIPEQVMHLFTDMPEVVAAGASYLRIVGTGYVFFGMTTTMLSAMRSVEMVRIGLINSLVALIMNICGNYLLIYGNCGFPAMGIRGAALATLISRMIEFAVVAFFVFRVDRNLRMRVEDFKRWDKDILHDLVKYGWPLVMGQAVWAFNIFMRSFVVGKLDQYATSAVSIADTYDGLLCFGGIGLAAAVGVMTGKAIGQNDFEKAKTQAKTMQVVFVGLGIVMGIICWSCCGWFASFYTLEQRSLDVLNTLFPVLTVIVSFRSYQGPCLMGLVKAGGDTSFVCKNDSIFVFFVVVPSALVAHYVFNAQPWVIYACLLCDQVLKCFVAVVKINSFNWMKNLTREAR